MTAAERIAENLADVRQRIAAAALRSDRRPEAVRLVAVTKYVDLATTRLLVEAGCRDLGESRPQALWAKAAVLPPGEVEWHLIGHLQTNKLRRTLPCLGWLHSGDSVRLLRAVDAAAAETAQALPVLLEVNISGDQAKHGFSPDALPRAFDEMADLRQIRIRGLMAMAGRDDDLAAARREFDELCALRDRLQASAPPGVWLDELSMGMSGDFEAAIEAGATLVRIGSALFKGVETHAE